MFSHACNVRVLRALYAFVRREAVFSAAFLCAAVSACFVPPSRAYIAYIDWNTLCILFALMGVVAALRSCGVFSTLGGILCRRFRSVRALSAVLVSLCFFFSMLITNDVALLTFVPFTIALLAPVADGGTVMRTVILQTIAENTGSMLTPLGNPQNLFLFQQLELPLARFLAVMLPYTALSAALLTFGVLLLPRRHAPPTAAGSGAKSIACACEPQLPRDAINAATVQQSATVPHIRHSAHPLPLSVRIGIYTALFVLCLLAVFRVLPKPVAAAAVLVVLLFVDRAILRRVDYMLLLTFGAFFVFTGNIAHIAPLRALLERAVSGHEFTAAILVSQGISNVPATLLLYPFTEDTRALLAGVNAGGLGTLVASLASLISYKLYIGARETQPAQLPTAGRYLVLFTLYNVVALLAMGALYVIIG